MDLRHLATELVTRTHTEFASDPLPDVLGNPARWMHDGLQRSLEIFQAGVEPGQRTGLCVTTPVSQMTIALDEIGWHDPDIITFRGSDERGAVLLVQHVSQLNAAFVALPPAVKKLRH